jgi:hypothetical protein
MEQIFKETGEQHHDSHCQDCDSDDNSDVVDTYHSWTLPVPSHKEALHFASINHIFLSPPIGVHG